MPASVSQVLGLQAYATTPTSKFFMLHCTGIYLDFPIAVLLNNVPVFIAIVIIGNMPRKEGWCRMSSCEAGAPSAPKSFKRCLCSYSRIGDGHGQECLLLVPGWVWSLGHSDLADPELEVLSSLHRTLSLPLWVVFFCFELCSCILHVRIFWNVIITYPD